MLRCRNVIVVDRIGTERRHRRSRLGRFSCRSLAASETFTRHPEHANDELQAKKPLKGADVEVEEIERSPSFYNAVFSLRRHVQLEGVDISFRLVGKRKQAACENRISA